MAIKQTLYRTSADTPIVRALIRAAEAGKQVVALVELQARFDEQANITWARTLEQAGVHVVYGVVGLKTHAKVCLVVRREGTGIRRYAHLGTGNYNSDTARVYEDLGLLTADQQLGNDVADLFNLLTGYSRQRGYGRLLVAPIALRSQVIELIRQQQAAGEDGRIALKLNSLVDPQTIDALYEASSAGVRIDLAIRGICCLRPKVPGLSETIRVRSIVGRFLEHSRIYRFGEPERGGRYYISSADLMPRNLDRRVEAAVPVDDPALRERLDEIIEITFADDVLVVGAQRRRQLVEGADRAGRRRPGDDDDARDREGPRTSMTMRVARPGAPSHLRVAGDPATIVTTALVGAVERLMLHDAEIRRGTDDPEAIHDARVAVRQIRSLTASLASVLDVDAIAQQVEQLGTFARALGEVRDLDVFLEDLAAETANVPEPIGADAARIASAVALERGIAFERLRHSMEAAKHTHLLMTLMSIAVDPPLRQPPRAPDPAVVMSSVWKALSRRAGAASGSSTDPVLHEVRTRAKRVRYAAEALAPFVGDRASAFAKSAVRLQDVLGRHQDSVIAIDKLSAVAAADPTLAFAAGWIAAGRERVRVETRAGWRDAWRSLAKKKRRFW